MFDAANSSRANKLLELYGRMRGAPPANLGRRRDLGDSPRFSKKI
jgi:hypothetical protein